MPERVSSRPRWILSSIRSGGQTWSSWARTCGAVAVAEDTIPQPVERGGPRQYRVVHLQITMLPQQVCREVVARHRDTALRTDTGPCGDRLASCGQERCVGEALF